MKKKKEEKKKKKKRRNRRRRGGGRWLFHRLSNVVAFFIAYLTNTESKHCSKVSKCKKNMKKWGLSEDDLCDCGSIQDEAHLLVCPNAAATCNEQDLLLVNDAAIQVAEYWKRSI
ncbi:hypothetical protein M8J77_008808 [Diaphorina citri]|nr:hypothetical protein M8J77_008808 [Diaphorina citri]